MVTILTHWNEIHTFCPFSCTSLLHFHGLCDEAPCPIHPERAQRNRGPRRQLFVAGVGVEGPAPCNFVKWAGNHEFNPTGTVKPLREPLNKLML